MGGLAKKIRAATGPVIICAQNVIQRLLEGDLGADVGADVVDALKSCLAGL